MQVNNTNKSLHQADVSSAAKNEDPIAIIGIGCRYPEASNAEELWQNLLAGKDSIGPYPSGRFPSVDKAYESSRKKPGRLPIDLGGFIPNIDSFDSQFFEISPRESVYLDPQHRLLLEVAWEALEDAGQVRSKYEGSKTSVFVGLWASEYEARLYESGTQRDFYSLIGCGRSSASGRVSFNFGLEGPSVTVDSACSSSLVAVHLACQSLWSEESKMALAGGANVILGSEIPELFTKANMLSADGHCKFGDASADGFVRSEGAGIVVLKRLSRAKADGDRVYAVIRGGAINSDGRGSGFLVTPSRPGQRQMLKTAWQAAGIDPARLRYIEAHGTGTAVGDPVELGALTDALTEAGVKDRCPLGSIKSNFGHTESAAGVAGLIKTALVLQHRVIPPTLHCKFPNPKIAWDQAPIRMATEAIHLQDEPAPILAGVSSFGMSGTNAHLVLEEAEQPASASRDADNPLIFPVSARTPEALHELLGAHLNDVRKRPESSLRDLCYTASVRRNHHEFRTAIVCADSRELEECLTAAVEDEAMEGVVTGRSSSEMKRVVFVAPGQGSQWLGMARELYESQPEFRRAFEECDRAIAAENGWSLADRLLGPRAEEYLDDIDVIQPALFTMSVALAAVWRSWGVEPDAVVGHSMGEVAAAHLAGILTLPDAVAVICRRSRLMKTLRSSGGMATVDLSLEQTEELLTGIEGLSVAASNGPRTTVISGDLKALESLLGDLKAKEIYCRLVKVDVASHSSQVDPILKELRQTLSGICPQPARIPMLSTVTGEFAFGEGAAGTLMDADYWVRNLRQCVLLAPAVKRFCETGHNLFIELSPHPILLPSIESAAREVNPHVLAVASLRREKPARATMLSGLASMYADGYMVDWQRLYPHGGLCITLPRYPFQREHCWPEPATGKLLEAADREGNPLLGQRFTSSRQPNTILWESRIGLGPIPYLSDHRVMRSAVFPAAGYVEMALSAIRALFPDQRFDLSKAAFLNACYLPEEGNRVFQLAITPDGGESFSFEIRSREEGAEADWTLHATGRLDRQKDSGDKVAENPQPIPIADLRADSVETRSAKEHYDELARGGLHYGPAFQVVEQAWVGQAGSLCRLRGDTEDSDRYVIHPALLDGSFQAMSHVRPQGNGFHAEDTFLPVAIDRVCIYGAIPEGSPLYTQAFLVNGDSEKGVFRLDLCLCDANGAVLLEARGMEVRRVARQDAADSLPMLYRLEWVLEDPPQHLEIPNLSNANWIIFADAKGVAETITFSLEAAGGRCVTVRPGTRFAETSKNGFEIRPDSLADLDLLFAKTTTTMGIPTAVVHLWTLDNVDAHAPYDVSRLMRSQAIGSQHVPVLVQGLTAANWQNPPRLWLVTAGSMAVDERGEVPHIENAPMWGIGRTVVCEHPELRATLVDLSASPDSTEARELARKIYQSGKEDRIALRGQQRYVARLALHASADPQSLLLGDGDEYRFEIENVGVLDNLSLRGFHPYPPGPGEVAIEVVAAGVNFRDIAKALGIYPGLNPEEPLHLGGEYSGRVLAVGEGVSAFAPGDEVLALAPSNQLSHLASRILIPAEWVIQKPARLSFDEAATIPIAFLTAYYSLIELARMRRGDWILIHAGAGGVGFAAIQLAKWIGANVIATVGSKEKEEFVRTLGVSHVFHSRSLDFAAGVMETTAGRGVDIVLNSLTGEFIGRGLEILAPYGRFVELGKRDIYEDRQVGLFAFRNNVSFHAVDLAAALEERSELIHSLLKLVMSYISSGEWQPAPVTSFSSGEPSEPFRFMAQARHIGKIAIRMERDVRVLPATDAPLFLGDANYLITGGLGGVALKVAEWMAGNGAGGLVLVSRRAVNDEAAEVIRSIEAGGTSVQVIRADVTSEADLDRVLQAIHATGRALKGVMHTAAVVDDGLIRDLSPERFLPVMAPKIEGTWKLHAATMSEKLDFFVLFSSIAAIHPQPGMGSYAAANAFLDAFAHYRRALGLPAISINWGGWSEIGLARATGTGRSIEGYDSQGIRVCSGQESLEALGKAMQSDQTQLVAAPFDWKKIAEFYGGDQIPSLFTELISHIAVGSGTRSSRSEIQDLLVGAESAEQQTELLETYLQETLSRVLKLAKRKIDRERPLGTMGLDSLMGLEFVRRLSSALQIAVPATVVFNYPTIRLLGRNLLQRLELQPIVTSPQEMNGKPEQMTNAGLPGGVSEEEALQALMGEEGRRV